MELKKIVNESVLYYLKNNELLIEFCTLFGMITHTYFYQKYEKNTELNTITFNLLISDLVFIIIVNDFLYTVIKYISIPQQQRTSKNVVCILIIPILQFYLNYKNFSNIVIESYYTTFFIFKFLWVLSNSIKTVVIYLKSKFVADLIKLVDTIWLINLLLIGLTDPLVNNEQEPNQVCFYEIYFRYIEYHNLILALYLIYHDRNIEYEVGTKTYTTSAIIGKYDSFRFTVILILTHYYFILINGLAFSPIYFIGFSSIFIAFYSISSYRQRKMINLYISFGLLLVFNLSTYLIALFYSVSQENEANLSNSIGQKSMNLSGNVTNST